MLENKDQIIEALEELDKAGLKDYGLLTCNGDLNVIFSLSTLIETANYFTALAAIRREMAECKHPSYEKWDVISGSRIHIPKYETKEIDDEGFIRYENLEKIDNYYRKLMDKDIPKEYENPLKYAEYDLFTDQYYIATPNDIKRLFIPVDIQNNIIYLDKGVTVDMSDEKSEAIVRDYINTFDYDKDVDHELPYAPRSGFSSTR